MNPEDKHLDVLQNIEAAVITLWKKHRDMTDYSVLRAYEAAVAHYKVLARGGTPKPEHLSGADAEVYAAVHAVCELRLGREASGPSPATVDEPELPPIPLEDLLACLKRLRKSVERWNRSGGQRGYLEFVSRFVG